MALTLTQTAKLTKRVIVLGSILLFVGITALVSYRIYYYNYYLPHKPPVEIPPTTTFGKLPRPIFPLNSISSSNYSYTLNTDTGGLPTDIPKIIKVFFLPQLGTNLLATDKATALANSLGFPTGPTISNDTQYGYTDSGGGSLTIDLVTGNFSFERSSSSSATINQVPILPDQGKLVTDFKLYLSSKNLLNDDIKNGRSIVNYNLASQQQATQAAISIWPQNINNLEVVTPDFVTGLINAVVTKATNEIDKYIKLIYIYWSPDTTNTATYPIKTASTAFADLQSGKGVVIVTPKNPQVSITSVKLAYFEPKIYTPYLQPIYVFEGEGFVAYVSGVTDEWLNGQ